MDVLTLDHDDGRTELAGDLLDAVADEQEPEPNADRGAEAIPARDDPWGVFRTTPAGVDIQAEEVAAFLDASAALGRALDATPAAVGRTMGVVRAIAEGSLPAALPEVAETLEAMHARAEAAIREAETTPRALPDSVPTRTEIEIAALRMALAAEMAALLRETARRMTPEQIPTAGQGTTLATVRATIRSRADDLTGLRAEVAVKLAVARS